MVYACELDEGYGNGDPACAPTAFTDLSSTPR